MSCITDIFSKTFVNDEWSNLRSSLKTVKEVLYSHICLPDFAPKRKIKILDVESSFTTDFSSGKTHKYQSFFTIFKHNFKKLLIKREPGIGKTTHNQYLTYQWSIDLWESFNDKLLLNVVLRDCQENEDIFDCIINQNFKKYAIHNKGSFKNYDVRK